ncbi:MAG: radical SAM protein [Thermodesulfobacteriota bacterium]|nr:radical SAM protein [Thermodesulfobacteriota bacterium]
MPNTNKITRDLKSIQYELGPSRPPSEARSLLIRATRGCPWHRCEFCSSHRTMKFELRSVEEIKRDIIAAKAITDKINEESWKLGYGGRYKELAASVYDNPPNENFRNVALWLYFGGENAFLQDANSLIMKTQDLIEVLRFLKEKLPTITRVTSYARSKTASNKTLEELKELKDAGLSRLHIGLESGSDSVLDFVRKGVTAEDQIKGGQKVVESGISLCEYIMPGLGGKEKSKEHMLETARVLNAINPDFIRLRSLAIREDLPLYKRLINGEFQLQTDDEVVKEIGELIQRLEVTSEFRSDHIENLLQEIEGCLPSDKENMLAVVNKYLALPDEERLNFQLGRRLGYYEGIDQLKDPYKHERVERTLNDIRSRGEDFEQVIFSLKRRFLV